ncbi:TVP38/TMEM64 family protein [soil metagenome]
MILTRRLLPVVLILALALALYSSGVGHYFTLDSLRENEAYLRGQVAEHPIASVAIYIAVYASITAACLPLNLITTLAGGMLFGPWVGGAATVVAATLGSMAAYFAARSAVGGWLIKLAEKKGGALQKIVEGFGRHAFSYVLSLRLIPIFPFWLVSIAAGVASPPMTAYVAGTALGVIPASFIYAGLGSGLGKVFAEGGHADLHVIFAPHIILPLVGLALLSLLPALVARWRAR